MTDSIYDVRNHDYLSRVFACRRDELLDDTNVIEVSIYELHDLINLVRSKEGISVEILQEDM